MARGMCMAGGMYEWGACVARGCVHVWGVHGWAHPPPPPIRLTSGHTHPTGMLTSILIDIVLLKLAIVMIFIYAVSEAVSWCKEYM